MAAETKGQEAQDVEMGESGKGPEPVGQVRSNDVRIDVRTAVECVCFDPPPGWHYMLYVWRAKRWRYDGVTRASDANEMLGRFGRHRALIMALWRRLIRVYSFYS